MRKSPQCKTCVRWTKEEDELLRTYGTSALLHELLPIISRHTKDAISVRRWKLGIRPSVEELSRINTRSSAFRNNDNLCKVDQNLRFDDLSNTTKQTLLGSMLGDGCVYQRRGVRGFCFTEGHSLHQEEYLRWKAKQLSVFLPVVHPCKAYIYFITGSSPIFTELRGKFYRDEEKFKSIIPIDLIKSIDELGLLIWYLDDGYSGVRKDGLNCYGWRCKPQPSICAWGWDCDDLNKTSELLNDKFNLHSYVYSYEFRGKLTKTLRFRSQDRKYLFSTWNRLAKSYRIPKCMRYKVNYTKLFKE